MSGNIGDIWNVSVDIDTDITYDIRKAVKSVGPAEGESVYSAQNISHFPLNQLEFTVGRWTTTVDLNLTTHQCVFLIYNFTIVKHGSWTKSECQINGTSEIVPTPQA